MDEVSAEFLAKRTVMLTTHQAAAINRYIDIVNSIEGLAIEHVAEGQGLVATPKRVPNGGTEIEVLVHEFGPGNTVTIPEDVG